MDGYDWCGPVPEWSVVVCYIIKDHQAIGDRGSWSPLGGGSVNGLSLPVD